MMLGTGLGIVFGLFLTGAMLYFDIDYTSRISAYDAAPACASTADISHCRYQGPAQIITKSIDDLGDLTAQLAFTELGGRSVSAYVDKTYSSQWQGWESGTTVNAELWQGEVAVVNGIPTLPNPDKLPNAGLVPVVVFGGATLVLVAWFIFSLILVRRDYAAYRQSAAR
jgi:hypothetical protein